MSAPLIWSYSPSDNQTVDAAAQWPEGQPASSLNNSSRGMMSRLAMARDDAAGILVATVNSSNVYTVTTNQSLIDPNSTAGGGAAKISKPFLIRVVLPTMPTAVATSAPTIVFDGTAAVPLKRKDGSALADGDLTGVPVEILGDTVTSGAVTRARVLDLLPSQFSVTVPAGILVGTLIDWPSTVTPDGYIEPVGALLSRTTYAALWSFAQASGMLVADSSWSANPGMFSSGDGSTTFRTMDVRGDFIRALDSGRGIDTNRALGSFQADAFKSHTHALTQGGVVISGYAGVMSANVATGAYLQIDSIAAAGGSETRPRNTAYRKLLKYK